MISCRRSNHALAAFFGGQREQFIERAALFESSGSLLVIEFEKDLVLGKAGKSFRVGAGGNADGLAYPAHRSLNVLDSDHSAGAAILIPGTAADG